MNYEQVSSSGTYGGPQEPAIFYDIPPPSRTQTSSFPTLEYVPPASAQPKDWSHNQHHQQTYSPHSPINHWHNNVGHTDNTHDAPSWHVPQNESQNATVTATFATPIPFDPVSPGHIRRAGDPAFNSQGDANSLVHPPRPQLHVDTVTTFNSNSDPYQQQQQQYNQHQPASAMTPSSKRSYEERHQLDPALLARLRQREAATIGYSSAPRAPPAPIVSPQHAGSIGQVMTNGMHGQHQAPLHRSYSHPVPMLHHIGHLPSSGPDDHTSPAHHPSSNVYDSGYQQQYAQHQNYAGQEAQRSHQIYRRPSASGPTTLHLGYVGSGPSSEIPPHSTEQHHQQHQHYTPAHTSINLLSSVTPQPVGDGAPTSWHPSASGSKPSAVDYRTGRSNSSGGGEANYIAAPVARSATMPDIFHYASPDHVTTYQRHPSQSFTSAQHHHHDHQSPSRSQYQWSSVNRGSLPAASSSSSPQNPIAQQQQHLQTIELDGAVSDGSPSVSGAERSIKSEPEATAGVTGASGANSKKSEKKPFLACKFCRGRKIQCGPGPKLPPEIECKLPPGPRTCNQCHKRGLVCRFPEASRRGLRGGKPSRLVVYGPDNRFRIVDADDIDAANGHPIYDEDFDGVGGDMDGPSPTTSADGWDATSPPPQEDKKGKGKKKERKGGPRPWSPMRFVPAVDTEILKELTARGVLLPVTTTKGAI
ncbi:hypothetical protein FRB95_009049 [Tulasnella sp. JGI-2019a]|nr:hypothetical protein FRB95_009049 [Tulasnella sp. JGI-2019a]